MRTTEGASAVDTEPSYFQAAPKERSKLCLLLAPILDKVNPDDNQLGPLPSINELRLPPPEAIPRPVTLPRLVVPEKSSSSSAAPESFKPDLNNAGSPYRLRTITTMDVDG